MIYSVWNQGGGRFDYFDDGRPQATVNVEKPTHLRQRELGNTVEQAAWPLPSDARQVGSGVMPRGRVAIPSGQALGASEGAMSTLKLGLLGASALLAWKFLLPKKRRSR